MPPRFQLPPGVTVLGLYRRILRNAKVFPSIKRDELVENIRLEFRENKSVTDPDKLAKCYETAVRGVSQLEKYTRLDPRASNWELELEQDPLGPGPDQDDEDDRELGTAPSER